MNIDFIKWMCGKAKSYMVLGGKIYYGGCYFTDTNHLWNDKLHIKVLLQEAIEGVNRDKDSFEITQEWDCINVDSLKYYFLEEMGEDQAKESALKYIYEQETK